MRSRVGGAHPGEHIADALGDGVALADRAQALGGDVAGGLGVLEVVGDLLPQLVEGAVGHQVDVEAEELGKIVGVFGQKDAAAILKKAARFARTSARKTRS